jgi:hypothetical protein
LLIVLLVVARRRDLPFIRSRSWPGTFATGTPRQRKTIMAVLPLGMGLIFLGAGQSVAASNRWLAGVLFVAAIAVFAVALVLFVRAGFVKAG